MPIQSKKVAASRARDIVKGFKRSRLGVFLFDNQFNDLPIGDLFIGGSFTTFDGVGSAKVIAYDESADTWFDANDGLPTSPSVPQLNSFCIHNNVLYGGFTTSTPVPAVWAWNPDSSQWVEVGSDPICGPVSKILIYNNELVALATGNLVLNASGATGIGRAATFDFDTGVWRPLGTFPHGTGSGIRDGVVTGGVLYTAGFGPVPDYGAGIRTNLFKVTGTSWVQCDYTPSVGNFNCITIHAGQIIIGSTVGCKGVNTWKDGSFKQEYWHHTNDAPFFDNGSFGWELTESSLWRWDGSTSQADGSRGLEVIGDQRVNESDASLRPGPNGGVNHLYSIDGKLYAVGNFDWYDANEESGSPEFFQQGIIEVPLTGTQLYLDGNFQGLEGGVTLGSSPGSGQGVCAAEYGTGILVGTQGCDQAGQPTAQVTGVNNLFAWNILDGSPGTGEWSDPFGISGTGSTSDGINDIAVVPPETTLVAPSGPGLSP